MYKFLQLLNSNKRKEILNLANFCYAPKQCFNIVFFLIIGFIDV